VYVGRPTPLHVGHVPYILSVALAVVATTAPPATVTHTFDQPGTYTIHFDFSTDANGLAQSSMEVTVVP
jgi:plastocyanin